MLCSDIAVFSAMKSTAFWWLQLEREKKSNNSTCKNAWLYKVLFLPSFWWLNWESAVKLGPPKQSIPTPPPTFYEEKNWENVAAASKAIYSSDRGWQSARYQSAVKPWSNGTPNSSQLEPSYKIKLASAVGQTVLPSRASLQENHSIV